MLIKREKPEFVVTNTEAVVVGLGLAVIVWGMMLCI